MAGKVLEEVKTRLAEKIGKEWDRDICKFRNVYPDIPQPTLTGPYQQRSRDIRTRINSYPLPSHAQGLDRQNDPYMLYGMQFYGAPCAIIILTDKGLYPKSMFDAGLIADTLCLAALDYGLGTCLMTAPVYWPDMLREVLSIPESRHIVLSIAIGYPDPKASINNFERPRQPVNAFTHWQGFDPG
jgi:hypothetical protein